jgi:hypothetical protein
LAYTNYEQEDEEREVRNTQQVGIWTYGCGEHREIE